MVAVPTTIIACGPRVEEIHMLPDDYTGPVLILADQRDGTAPEYRGSARIYRIPPSGVLKTQFSIHHGPVDLHFYRGTDTLGPGIPILDGPDQASAGTGLYVFGLKTGSYSRGVRRGDTTRAS